MANVARFQVEWQGLPGGLGVSSFYVSGDGTSGQASWLTAVQELFRDFAQYVPEEVIWRLIPEVSVFDAATGLLQSVRGTPAFPGEAGFAAGVWSAASGARLDWHTGQVVAGKRMTGRTYVVPLASNGFSAVGGLSSAAIIDLQAAANTYLSAVTAGGEVPVVWSRLNGDTYPITTVAVPPQGSVLRSRRD